MPVRNNEKKEQNSNNKTKPRRGVRFTEDTVLHTSSSSKSNKTVTAATSATGSNHNSKRALDVQAAGIAADGTAADDMPKRYKRPRIDRPNADELDDVDDYVASDDDDDNDNAVATKTQAQLLQAKRKRRLLQHNTNDNDNEDDGDDEDDSRKNETYLSLADEGIPIEPFNMDQETSDGRGYFDGDTYVFRKEKDEQQEPDAWLESLDNQNGGGSGSKNKNNRRGDADKDNDSDESNDDSQGADTDTGRSRSNSSKMDQWTVPELYSRMLPLVSDTESIMQAIARYGNLMKQEKLQLQLQLPQRQRKKTAPAAAASSSTGNEMNATTAATSTASIAKQDAISMAQAALNTLTEAASALLLKGEIDIYQKTRTDLLQILPASSVSVQQQQQEGQQDTTNTTAAAPSSTATVNHNNVDANDNADVSWEYQGSQDGQIHGPYTSQQMHGWVQQGYFVGTSVVRIRPIWKNTDHQDNGNNNTINMKDDLLADLMDDDGDGDEEEKDGDKKPHAVQETRGEWMLSDQVDFAASHQYKK